jgi:ribosome-binding factor A
MSRDAQSASQQRPLRVGEAIRHALSAIFQREELRDPGLAGVTVTVSEVRVSPDLRHARVFVSSLGGLHEDEMVKALRHAQSFLRKRLGEQVPLRYVPELTFQLDDSFAEADRIGALLHRPDVARDLSPSDRRERKER